MIFGSVSIVVPMFVKMHNIVLLTDDSVIHTLFTAEYVYFDLSMFTNLAMDCDVTGVTATAFRRLQSKAWCVWKVR
jgi:hypothetical protein